MLDVPRLREFGERGYLLVPGVVPRELIAAAKDAVVRLLEAKPPPAGHTGGHHYGLEPVPPGPLLAPLVDTPAFALAEALIRPGKLAPPEALQVALNVPWNTHRPGGPHIDGITPGEKSGRPGTFTMLAGIFLTDQQKVDMGNLWVWPGTHLSVADYLRVRGPDAIWDATERYYPFPLPPPEPVLGRAGDLVLAHYMCGHNSSGNESDQMRQVLYYRLRREGHRERWRDCVTDALLEHEPVRAAMGL
jgi:hypothetical protein